MDVSNWDHPRIRGEHSFGLTCPRATRGSSPHTRGAPKIICRECGMVGIIPAYAGSTRPRAFFFLGVRDHPRIRGEHLPRFSVPMTQSGSSPHTRGAPPHRSPAPARAGIIPAYAGSTLRLTQTRQGFRDHPRIRGEHQLKDMEPAVESGSSPHTRGAPQKHHLPFPHRGIIPAYAGSTAIKRQSTCADWDHLRIRGEHAVKYGHNVIYTGSSPHTRGALSC